MQVRGLECLKFTSGELQETNQRRREQARRGRWGASVGRGPRVQCL